jgi:CheY-like chemotaxis protein
MAVPDTTALKGKRILIADDEKDLREILADELRYCGCEVSEAENGKAAYATLEKQPFDLIISDIRMPGGDGIELLKAVRARDPKLPPLVLISGYSDITEKEALALGARRVFVKPFNLNELVTEVVAAIAHP